MSERSKSIARIVALQSKVKTMAAARLVAAEAAKRDVVDSREALNQFMAKADLTGAFAQHAIRSAHRLDREEAVAERQRLAMLAARVKVETRLKLAEKLGAEVAREERAIEERRRLERLIEEAVGREGSGEP